MVYENTDTLHVSTQETAARLQVYRNEHQHGS